MEHFQLSPVTWECHVTWWNIFSWAPSLGNVPSFDGTFSAEPGRPGNVAPSGNPASPARRWLRLVIFPIENVPSRSIKRNGFFARGKWRFRLLRTKNELFSIPFWQPAFRCDFSSPTLVDQFPFHRWNDFEWASSVPNVPPSCYPNGLTKLHLLGTTVLPKWLNQVDGTFDGWNASFWPGWPKPNLTIT